MNATVACLVASLDHAFDHRSWHGPNLRGSLRAVSREVLLWRPQPERHNIWELVVHAAYWKYAVRRRLTSGKMGSFPLAGNNFWSRSADASESDWKRDVALLVDEHKLLREAVVSFPATRLQSRPANGAFTHAEMIQGAAAHDLYHAGQIQLLKRLARAHRS